jgi:methylated-DNA-[protein]-cysteine S-methyltransferase
MGATAALVETAIGWCGVAWGDDGVVAVQLPERDRNATAARLRRRLPAVSFVVPSGPAEGACAGIVALVGGEPIDLRGVVLDLRDASPFERSVYDVARAILPGATKTYGEIAAEVGQTDAARAVGRAMGRNPCPLIVPCHRVLAAHGELGGFSAFGGTVTKRRLLFIEGALASEPLSLF